MREREKKAQETSPHSFCWACRHLGVSGLGSRCPVPHGDPLLPRCEPLQACVCRSFAPPILCP